MWAQGFSAGGTNLLFENNFIQNGDDCLTVGNKAQNIQFKCVPCIFIVHLLNLGVEIATVKVAMGYPLGPLARGAL